MSLGAMGRLWAYVRVCVGGPGAHYEEIRKQKCTEWRRYFNGIYEFETNGTCFVHRVRSDTRFAKSTPLSDSLLKSYTQKLT